MQPETREPLAIVILAAGIGKRMKNPALPKVLVELAGKPLLGHVLAQARELNPTRTIIIVGHHAEKVEAYVNSLFEVKAEFAVQNEQLGTGHAVLQAGPALRRFEGDVLILCGDVPLLSAETLRRFIRNHTENRADLSVLSADAPNAAGYGRIVRDRSGHFLKITEEKDSTDEIRKITEFNSGVYLVNSSLLFGALQQVSNNNAQGEYYLTDIVGILNSNRKSVIAYKGTSFEELQGINSPEQLAKAEEYYYQKIK
jgi:bifunctional UDP-N-acetylglucosamine pyrophosphorylase/glucosamine-1-phosphate N-acetyltransferase